MNERFCVLDGALDALFESDDRPVALVGFTSHEMSSEKWIEVHSDFSLAKQRQLQALRQNTLVQASSPAPVGVSLTAGEPMLDRRRVPFLRLRSL